MNFKQDWFLKTMLVAFVAIHVVTFFFPVIHAVTHFPSMAIAAWCVARIAIKSKGQ